MSHPIHSVRTVEVVQPFVLRLTFGDGLARTIDLEPILAGAIYGPLRDPEIFSQVRVDPEVHTIVWPNGADFDPATLHDWPDHAEAFQRKAREWARSSDRRGRTG